MSKFIKLRIYFLSQLYKEGIGWKIVSGLWGVLSLLIFFRDDIALPNDDKAFKVIFILQTISFQTWLIITLLLFIIWFFESSFQLYRRLSISITELGKIDKDDLCYLLKGYYIGNTFAYKAEIVLCARFEGKFKINQLVEKFIEVEVLAPKFSLANIKIELFNGHNSAGAKYEFYLLDTRNKEILVKDIYDYMGQEVYLDGNSKFSIKLKHNELFEINDNATILITLNSWSK